MTLTLVEQRTSAARAPGGVATRRVRIAVPSVVILVATSAVVWTGASSLPADHRLPYEIEEVMFRIFDGGDYAVVNNCPVVTFKTEESADTLGGVDLSKAATW